MTKNDRDPVDTLIMKATAALKAADAEAYARAAVQVASALNLHRVVQLPVDPPVQSQSQEPV